MLERYTNKFEEDIENRADSEPIGRVQEVLQKIQEVKKLRNEHAVANGAFKDAETFFDGDRQKLDSLDATVLERARALNKADDELDALKAQLTKEERVKLREMQ